MRLFVETEPYGDMRPATTEQLVAALIAEGGEIRETHLSHRTGSGEVERAITAPVHGRYLIYLIPVESAEAKGESPEVPT